MPIATLPDTSLHYTLRGSGDPVVLVMGLGLTGEGWELQVETLSRSHAVLTFDNRGSGRSSTPEGPYSTDQLADDTLRLMDHLGIDRAHIVGTSMGGMVVQKLALRAPRRVRSLALLATHGGGVTTAPLPWSLSRFYALRRAQTPEARYSAVSRLLFSPGFLAQHERELRQRLVGGVLARRQPEAGFRGQLVATVTHRTGPALRTLRGIPTLIAHGTADPLIHPVNAARLNRWMPWARRLMVLGAGHGVIVEAREALDGALGRLFAAAA